MNILVIKLQLFTLTPNKFAIRYKGNVAAAVKSSMHAHHKGKYAIL